NGSNRDFTGTLAQDRKDLASWLLNATAVHTSYMLSARWLRIASQCDALQTLINEINNPTAFLRRGVRDSQGETDMRRAADRQRVDPRADADRCRQRARAGSLHDHLARCRGDGEGQGR